MKLTIDKASFLKAISKVEGIISSRELKSQLSNILFEASDNVLKLTSTDLEVYMKTRVECEIEVSGEITLPAKKISQIVKAIPGDKIKLESKPSFEAEIIDASGTSHGRFAIHGLPKSEFPTIPAMQEDKLVEFPNMLVQEMLRQTSYAIAEEDSRFVFNGLFMISDKSMVTFVATDGKRMSKIDREFPVPLDLGDGIIVPHKAVREIQRILEADENGKLGLVGNQLFVTCKDVELLCNLIEGPFPSYNQVIPTDFNFEVDVSRENLSRSIKLVSVLANEQSQQVKMSFEKERLTVVASTPEVGEADDFMPCGFDGEPMEIGFNYQYVLDAVGNIPGDDLSLCMNSETAPLVLKNKNDANFVAVIMPMKL